MRPGDVAVAWERWFVRIVGSSGRFDDVVGCEVSEVIIRDSWRGP